MVPDVGIVATPAGSGVQHRVEHEPHVGGVDAGEVVRRVALNGQLSLAARALPEVLECLPRDPIALLMAGVQGSTVPTASSAKRLGSSATSAPATTAMPGTGPDSGRALGTGESGTRIDPVAGYGVYSLTSPSGPVFFTVWLEVGPRG